MNLAWDDFKPCPALKSLIPVVSNHSDTIEYYEVLRDQIFHEIAELLNETSDTKISEEQLTGHDINAIYDSYNSDKFHDKPHLQLN